MVIRSFVFILLGIALVSYFIPVQTNKKNDKDEDIVLLSFNDSTMYTLTPDSMNRIIYSKKVLRYKNRDVMIEGALTLKGKDKDNKEITDILYADIIIKRDDIFNFFNNVRYRRDETITLNTDELFYNSKSKIATNTLPFDGTYFNNYIKGEQIYLDMNKYYMKANDTHFEVEIQKN
ncbi:MAG: hypothetical protein C0625_13800 [Arcobacter sp.]|nr:MAG: hypothetical protein C0625_13800 [Arcobacter sp.]